MSVSRKNPTFVNFLFFTGRASAPHAEFFRHPVPARSPPTDASPDTRACDSSLPGCSPHGSGPAADPDRRGHQVIAQNRTPFLEPLVGCQISQSPLVTHVDQLEEQPAAVIVESRSGAFPEGRFHSLLVKPDVRISRIRLLLKIISSPTEGSEPLAQGASCHGHATATRPKTAQDSQRSPCASDRTTIAAA